MSERQAVDVEMDRLNRRRTRAVAGVVLAMTTFVAALFLAMVTADGALETEARLRVFEALTVALVAATFVALVGMSLWQLVTGSEKGEGR